MVITHEAVLKVPALGCRCAASDKLRAANRDILEYIRGDPDGTEAAGYYNLKAELLARYKGAPGGYSVSSTRFEIPHWVVHNHPDGMTFSMGDFVPFLSNPNTLMMSVVGNDGSVYLLEKDENYEAQKAAELFIEIDKLIGERALTAGEIEQICKRFYRKLGKFGFYYKEVGV